MADRKRRRTIIGYTEIPCPHCGGGPLVLTSSRFTRRLRDRLKPGFDPKVVYRETCSACRMRFSVSPDAKQPMARSVAMAGAPAPTPLFAPDEVDDDLGDGAARNAADSGAARPAAVAEEPVRPATPIRSTKPTQAAFFTDDDELDED